MRYCLITSWESNDNLEAYINKYHGVSRVPNAPLDQSVIDAATAEVARRREERAARLAEQGKVHVDVMSEA